MSRVSFSLPGVIDTPSRATWDDLILPERCIQSLREFATWVTHREQVEQEWGGRVGGGPMALFSGASGTGKTIASEVLGSILGLDLYRVDLGRAVSKYIGETEKNLDALFDAAAREPVLLVFDEADCLIGKRSEAKDAHDRYANLEVSYLLSRLERHKGPCILTTNNEERVDSALVRRFQFLIDFPLPDAAQRARLWRLYLPGRAPIERDVDTDDLAREFELTGGQIRNAAMHAAFRAAGESSSITRKHVTGAVKDELLKAERAHERQDI